MSTLRKEKLGPLGFPLNIRDAEDVIRGIESSYRGGLFKSDTDGNIIGAVLSFSKRTIKWTEIQTYWNGLTALSSESSRAVSGKTLRASMEAKKISLLSKSWDSMTSAEKKLLLNIEIDLEGLGIIPAKS